MPNLMLIIVVVVAIVVVALVVRFASSKNPGPEAHSAAGESSSSLGLWSLECGLLAVAGVAMIGQATYEWVPGFDPPGWLRIVVIWMFPIGVIVSTILGVLSLKRNAGRTVAENKKGL